MQRQTQRRNGTTLLEDIQLKSAAVALGDALQDLQPVAVPRLLLGGFLAESLWGLQLFSIRSI